MAKTPTLETSAHPSGNFGGIKKQGDDARDCQRGGAAPFKNDRLADHLIASELTAAK